MIRLTSVSSVAPPGALSLRAAFVGIVTAAAAAAVLALLAPGVAPPTRPPAEPREVFKGDRLDRQVALADPTLFARVDPPLVSPVADLFPLPVPQPPQTAPAADPEPVRRHRRAGGAGLCARHGLRTIWYDNGRRWHCRR